MRPTRQNRQIFTGWGWLKLSISTQVNATPYQIDKPNNNKPHSLIGRQNLNTSTQLDKHNKPYYINQQSLYTIYKTVHNVRTPQHESTRQTRPTGKASRRIGKGDRFHWTLWTRRNDQLKKLHRLSLAIFFRRSFLICEVRQLNSIFFRNIRFSTL